MFLFLSSVLSNNSFVVVYFILLNYSVKARETSEGSPFVARHVV